MKQILFVSQAAGSAAPNDKAEILRASIRNNPELGITGILIISDQTFIQLLEGPEDHIDALMECIADDARHTDLFVLEERDAAHRAFPHWAMAHATLDPAHPVIVAANGGDRSARVPAAPGLIDAVVCMGQTVVPELRAG